MKFDIQKTIEIIGRTPAVLNAMLYGISEEWLYCNEGENTWSVFEVVGHLIIAEQTDFIPRTELILSNANEKIIMPIDLTAHIAYCQGKSITDLLHEFEQRRKASIQKLLSLKLTESDLDKTGQHAEVGTLRVREVLAKWAPHDLNHIAQIARVIARQYTEAAGPFAHHLGILQPRKK